MSEGLVEWLRAQLLIEEEDGASSHAFGCSVFDVVYEEPPRDAPLTDPRSCSCKAFRVLQEVEALRALVDLHSPRKCNSYSTDTGEARIQCEYCAGLCHSRSGLGCEDPVDALYPCDTVRLVAAIFDQRPGYQESWRPT